MDSWTNISNPSPAANSEKALRRRKSLRAFSCAGRAFLRFPPANAPLVCGWRRTGYNIRIVRLGISPGNSRLGTAPLSRRGNGGGPHMASRRAPRGAFAVSVPHAECHLPWGNGPLLRLDIRHVKAGDRPHRPEKLADGGLSALELHRDGPIAFIPDPAGQAQPAGQRLRLPAEADPLDKSRKPVTPPDRRRPRITRDTCDIRLRAGVFQPLHQTHFPPLLDRAVHLHMI